MAIQTKISESPDDEWNIRLLNSRYSTIHQTVDYTEYIKAVNNMPSYYVTFHNNGQVLGQMVLHKISRLRKKLEPKLGDIPLFSKLLNLTKTIKPMYVWHFGPVIFNIDYKNEIFHEISKLRKTLNAPIYGSIHPLLERSIELVENGWKERKTHTFLIDLSLTTEQLWNNIDRHSGRKAVKRAQNKQVIIKPIESLDDLKIHHQLLNEGMEIAGLGTYPFVYIKKSWEMLKNVGQFGFIAWHGNYPLASTLVTTFNGYMNEWGFARSKYDRDNLLNGPDIIKWHLIEWGHNNRFRIFDLTGVNPDSHNKKDQGIYKFKKKWGGQLREWYHYNIS
ncbi:peptidoglycan bridge formation glycyltransferase FemA/FemB family protein [Candidatus Nitrosotenuis uzonensis]|uniref:BioF2-like acetyltransferase domain-containing protein n=1 Tax=Candidatus Nitrosotenuis uzonensis TaxID=1407055 RepID=A0A812F2U4_9ARCH|nr:peptidoglycan bridge formation glycyltransferase FemA/FemB family protein [Candidatus Nitrosotenuis uzonensis]CAE6488184.1 conserved hypothetical protein [Candidatus Nitrosotenuis uzonensis]